jgi:hypothetical protein
MPYQQSPITIKVPVCFPVEEANRDFIVLGEYASVGITHLQAIKK